MKPHFQMFAAYNAWANARLYAVAAGLADADYRELRPGASGAVGNQGLLAAGTGLGEAGLHWDGRKHRAFACEGGHTSFAPTNEREDALLVGLEWETDAINRRINARVKMMLEEGLLGETRGLIEAGKLVGQAREGLGYKQLIEHIEGRCSLDDAVELIKVETRRFAKNQRTWLRRLRATPGSVWIEMGEQGAEEIAQTIYHKLFNDG